MKQKNDVFHTDKPLYDYSIEYDYNHLSDYLKEIIVELEAFDRVGDWFSYFHSQILMQNHTGVMEELQSMIIRHY